MLLKNDGFFMAELLLSLSAWLIATSVLLPLTLVVIGQSVQLSQEADATYLLYDRLQQMKFQPEPLANSSIEKAGTNFVITTNRKNSGSNVEVCVEFDGFLRKETSICALAE